VQSRQCAMISQMLPVLYIDAHMIVIDKPAGLAVHPGPATLFSLENRLRELTFGFHRLPQPVHRLDRDTSGCLVLARHPKAARRLGLLFESGLVSKTYLAVLDGIPSAREGRIDAPLQKVSSREMGWRIVVDPKGKPAATSWRVLADDGERALVEFAPETGRTHQIRVHAAHALEPIAGDPVYGATSGPMRLHALRIVVGYVEGAPPVDVSAPLPEGWPIQMPGNAE
jgi:tRNA pseudouridine32 synthase/23S rRNA pseudouridine746 synthase